jgi:hypothetical protein
MILGLGLRVGGPGTPPFSALVVLSAAFLRGNGVIHRTLLPVAHAGGPGALYGGPGLWTLAQPGVFSP